MDDEALPQHGRSLIAFTAWSHDRMLAAADGISADQYGQIRRALEHMLGTQRWWHGKWTGANASGEPELPTLAHAREAYAVSHEQLRAFGSRLTLGEWNRSEQWWLEFGYQVRLPLGESITQVVFHGVQHRSEIAMMLTEWQHSPGDLDYLVFLREANQALPSE